MIFLSQTDEKFFVPFWAEERRFNHSKDTESQTPAEG
jgi:hypothetical protein